MPIDRVAETRSPLPLRPMTAPPRSPLPRNAARLLGRHVPIEDVCQRSLEAIAGGRRLTADSLPAMSARAWSRPGSCRRQRGAGRQCANTYRLHLPPAGAPR